MSIRSLAVGREAAIPALCADYDERFALVAARDADRELSALVTHHERPVQYRLNGFARQHGTCRCRTIQVEAGTLDREIDCHGLQAGCERGGIASREDRHGRDCQNTVYLFLHD